MTTSLELGCDCLGEIRYLDAVLHNSKGEPYTIPNAICIHEEDNAVLWKHVDHDAGAEVRRMRRLTVSFHVTVANYEYLVYWRFYQDGNIECEVRATGIMVITPLRRDSRTPTAPSSTSAPTRRSTSTSWSPGSTSTSTARTTPCYMTETYAEPIGPDNPHGLSLVHAQHAAAHRDRGQAGLRLRDPAGLEGGQHQRRQRARHPSVLQARARRRHPADVRPDVAGAPARQVIGHTLWVTPNQSRRALACGEFVNQSATDTGLARVDDGRPVASRTPTWCSGTCSASTTSPGRRTGR